MNELDYITARSLSLTHGWSFMTVCNNSLFTCSLDDLIKFVRTITESTMIDLRRWLKNTRHFMYLKV